MRQLRYICPITVIILIFTGSSSSSGKTGEESLIFLPEARLYISSSATSEDNNSPSAILSRYLAIDAFRYGPLACSFSAYEIMNYGDNDAAYNFNSIYYSMEYINVRLDSSRGRASAFINHRCENFVNRYADEEATLRWYGYGLRWETPGMMIGYRDRRYGYSILPGDDYLNFEVSVEKPLSSRRYSFDYIAGISLRYDFYLTGGIIPFLSGGAGLLYSAESRWNYSGGTGVRFSLDGVDVVPYAEFSSLHRDDSDSCTRYIEAGIRFESIFSETGESIAENATPAVQAHIRPELHIRGSYSKYIGDEYRNFRSDMLFALSLAVTGRFSLFGSSSLVHSSPQLGDETGLYPRYIDYFHEAGISLNSGYDILVEPLYKYSGYGEGNTDTGASYTRHMAAIRITTQGMKPGRINRAINGFSSSLKLLLNTEAEMLAGWFPGNDNRSRYWLLECSAREDIMSFKSAVAYVSLNAKTEKGAIHGEEDITMEIKPECGIRFNSKLLFMIFYQYIRSSTDTPAYDVNREYHLAGIRLDI